MPDHGVTILGECVTRMVTSRLAGPGLAYDRTHHRWAGTAALQDHRCVRRGAAMRSRRQDAARSAGATAMTDLDRDGLETVTMGNRGFPEIGRTVHLPGCGRPTGSLVEADPP